MNCKSGHEKKKQLELEYNTGKLSMKKKIGYDLDFPSFT